MGELELVRHPQMEGMHLFFDTVEYRAPHMHREFELIWVVEEPLAVKSDGGACTLAPGDWAVFTPGQIHELSRVEGDCTFLCLQTAPRLLAQFYPACERLRLESLLPRDHLPPQRMEQLRARLRAAARAYVEQPPFYQLTCAGQVCLLWQALFAEMPGHTVSAQEAAQAEKRGARIQRLMRFVDENYMHPIRLADFARAEGCSVNHMSFLVHQALNQSFQQYVNGVRFHCACRLMDAGRTRLTDVCLESGFSDYRYFSKAFRDRLGLTPEEYRRRAEAAARPQDRRPPNPRSRERFYTREKSRELLALL